MLHVLLEIFVVEAAALLLRELIFSLPTRDPTTAWLQ